VLFESAADIYRDRLLGIVLTGANQDGARGLAAVRRLGGSTVVQQPAGAYAPFMPESALKQGPVDFVLSLKGIAELLRTLNHGGGR
jgi:two-component system, chemotaxis family, protein-glutamate methylesterase/glutaminase